jgi:hypothetical protein
MSVANIKFRSFDLELYVMITNQSITAHANHPVVIPKSKMIFKVSITTLIRKWELAKYYATLMNPLPAYVAMGGRDCDDYSWSRLDKFPNHYQAVKEIESAQEWADGPMGGHLVSKKEYLKLKREKEEEEATYSRDDEEEVEATKLNQLHLKERDYPY